MSVLTLRAWQEECLKKIKEGFISGHKNQVISCPTGGGKTILAMKLIQQCLAKGKRAIFAVDRKTIVNQSSVVADALGMKDHSILMAKHERFDPSSKLQIASLQTIARRGWTEADLIIIDECHVLLKAWTNHVKTFKGAVIGLSATPFSNLGGYFTNLINAATMKDLVADGILVPMKIYSCTKIDMKNAATKNGEWSAQAASERGSKIVGNVVREWIQYGEGRKTLVFGANIAHCESLCAEFNEAGIMARMFTSYTKDAERFEILEEFKKEDSYIKILLTVDALAKGFDNPLVSCICDVRPLRKSFSTAVQIWGRMLRCAPNKKDAILLDFSGNIVRFGTDFERLYMNGLKSLKHGLELDKMIRKETLEKEHKCPECGYIPFYSNCMSCGHSITKRSKIEALEGSMRQIKLRFTLDQDRNIFDQCYTLCLRSKGDINTVKGRTAHLYKSITGEFPKYNDPKIVVVEDWVVSQQKHTMIKFRLSKKRDAKNQVPKGIYRG